MPRKQAVDQAIYLDEAEGFILEHALFSPPRTWPPLPPETQEVRLAATLKKMDWEEEVRAHPDEPIDIPIPSRARKHSITTESDDDANKERCVICLMELRDRTIVGVCGHEFCFECIGVWANQSRRCPLCSADMAPFLLHDLDANTPTKFYLPPLPSRKFPPASLSLPGPSRPRIPEIIRREEREAEAEEPDELDLQVERRKEIYRHELYVKHIGSNPHTKYRPTPTPRQFSEDPALIQRATAFLRRELRVWSDSIDVEFLTTYIISLLKTIDIRSEPAIRLLADYLDPNPHSISNETHRPHIAGSSVAEHISHELYSFLRSPFKDLRKWDEVIQYDPIPSPLSHRSAPSPSSVRARSRSRSRSRSLSRSSSRSLSPLSSSSSPERSSKRGRNWSKRDVFVPSVSPDAKRWDETDTWLDPEYAGWLEEEKRREEDRRERKRLRRSSRRASQYEREQETKPMRVWGEQEKKRVELLPEPEEPPLRMDEAHDIEDIKVEEDRIGPVGLSIKGAARSNSVSAAIPNEPRAKRELRERLEREKARVAAIPQVLDDQAPLNGRSKMTPQEMKERLMRMKAERAAQRPASTDKDTEITPPVNGLDKTAKIREKLDRLKAQGQGQTMKGVVSPVPVMETLSPIDQNSYDIHDSEEPFLPPPKSRLSESKRRSIRIKTRLETERVLYVKNTNESKAQELRRKILEHKARREKEQIESNYGNIANDEVLRKMDSDERKREVRRRLMSLKMLSAETKAERRQRELKERLMKRRVEGVVVG
ncbi:hypothetical protein I302_101757 [Kwoniella bestiolae CBS 10118]|uniref:RING-type E3 ubiquitin transferase n=1 Tax=Kwoniella bestiolae CBS 10118 TaxID=1296100 RepID=A0A1B9GD47_9TREE|nr:hypothetical protein I302_00435 [Kwoniella bestiolae CBS 10118]OCF28945.1 hypothetical protein I302_00435 [Kwoniella bestiolae CBS 10118]